jgi:hypothetical protein
MKLAICVLVALGLWAFPTSGQKQKTIAIPTYFVKAEAFVELGESERQTYTTGLIDGFFGAALFGADNEAAERLNACTKSMDSKQISAIILKYVKDHPEGWNLPLSMQAYNAMNGACPGGIHFTPATQ